MIPWICQRDKWAANQFEIYKMCGEECQDLRTRSLEKVNSRLLQYAIGRIIEALAGRDDTLNLVKSMPWQPDTKF